MGDISNIGVADGKNVAGKPIAINTPGQVLFASLIGTTIEFFDFYIYATAAALTYRSRRLAAGYPLRVTLGLLSQARP